MPRLAVLGTLVWDTIWHPSAIDAEPVERWGGIAYSLAGLSAACPEGWTLDPIVRVGRDLADEAALFIESLPHVSLGEGFRIVEEPNNRVELRYGDDAERTEHLTGGVSSWSWTELEPLLQGADALYVNFISGYELTLESADRLPGLPIPLYADLHSLFLGPPESMGPRRPVRPGDLKRWVGAFDAIQLNEHEIRLAVDLREWREAVAELARWGPSMVFMTRGSRGAAFTYGADVWHPSSWSAERGNSHRRYCTGELPLDVSPVTGDPTGCGDIWGAVAFSSLLKGIPPEISVRRANAAAAARIGIASITDLPDTIAAALDSISSSL